MTENEGKQTAVPEKIKILFLAANPAFTPPLKIDQEIRTITEKIHAAEYRDSLELVSAWAVRPDDLIQALNEHKPHIVHFSGHGETTGELNLLDKDGNPKPVKPEAIRSLFTNLKDNIRIVFFNACHTGIQAQAISKVIDCVIGMNTDIKDQAAPLFAASFYRALGFGRSVKEAFEQGRTALMLEGIPGEDIPELLTKEGIDPAQLFLVKTSPPPPPPNSFEKGLENLEKQEYAAAFENFQQALQGEPENEERRFYYCLSFLARKPLLAIEKRDMDEINRLLNKTMLGVDSRYANLARIVLGIIHYDYYIKQGQNPRGLDARTIFRYLGHNPPSEKEKQLVSHITYSENAATMCYLH